MRSGRLIAAAFAMLLAVGGYFLQTRKEVNPVTGENQRVALTVDQEIALGLQSVPEMSQQFGGEVPDPQAQNLVDRIGEGIVQANLSGSPYRYDFHLLADPQTVNAFALPGGQVFITAALAARLETEGQLAAVLGHEIGHVEGRHSAEQMAKAMLYQGLASAGTIATYDPNNPQVSAALPQLVAQFSQMKNGRDDELQADELGVKFMSEAGYDPRAMIRVMQILAEASGDARQPEFASTHPDPGNRIARIEAAIQQQFPSGVPAGLKQ